MTEDQITNAAIAMRSEASRFGNPVHSYVDREYIERMTTQDEDWHEEDHADEDLTLESWKILARAALSAIS